jgi:predicted nucleic acid-binding protein
VSLVLDASMSMAWLFADETTEATEALFDEVAVAGATVPAIWKLEVANGLQRAMRRGRISQSERNLALDQLTNLPIDLDSETNQHAWVETLVLADRHGLTPYDASYLELALRLRQPLATLDGSLARAGKAEGIEVRTA